VVAGGGARASTERDASGVHEGSNPVGVALVRVVRQQARAVDERRSAPDNPDLVGDGRHNDRPLNGTDNDQTIGPHSH